VTERRRARALAGALAAALGLGGAGCDDRAGDAPAPSARGPRRAAPHATILAPREPAPAAAVPEESAIAIQLARGRLAALEPTSTRPRRPGHFDGKLVLGDATFPVAPNVRVALATAQAPRAHRRALAYYRLSHAIGARVVPPMVERRLPGGELAALLAPYPPAKELLATGVPLRNDGSVEAALSALSSEAAGSPWQTPDGRELALVGAPEAGLWSRWLKARSAAPDEVPGLVRAYAEMRALDYLAGNVLRRTAWLAEASRTLVLTDNQTAFGAQPDRASMSRALDELRSFARFPRALRDGLLALDADRATALFNAGEFDDWLLAPRVLVELGERRAALLSLIEARIQERGEAAVLAL
jgi:hypothetical protein